MKKTFVLSFVSALVLAVGLAAPSSSPSSRASTPVAAEAVELGAAAGDNMSRLETEAAAGVKCKTGYTCCEPISATKCLSSAFCIKPPQQCP